MPHVLVTCRTCGSERLADLTPPPPTPFVDACPDCSGSNARSATDTTSYSVRVEVHDDEGVLTRISGTFESTSLLTAMQDGTLARALEPLWNKMQEHAAAAEETP